jgi:5'-3' exonuclease
MNLLLTDANGVGYYGNNKRILKDPDGEPVQAVFESIKYMWSMARRHSDYTPLILWDETAQWRYDLHPEYKGKRDVYDKQKESRAMYKKQRPDVELAFDLMGFTKVRHAGFEADDIAALYARKIASNPSHKAKMLSSDHDWMQLIADNVDWISIQHERQVSKRSFYRETGYETVGQFVQDKALVGDTSDNICGVGGIGEKTAKKIITHFGGVKAFLQHHRANGDFTKESLPDEFSRDINKMNTFCNSKDGIKIFKRNLALMNLHNIDKPDTPFTRVQNEPDKIGFIDFCMDRGFTSLVTKADQIFQDLEKGKDNG